jgi:hypothetical protein
MTINGCEFDKPCSGDPRHNRDAAAGYLVKIGYALVERSDRRVHLKFQGRWFTTDPEEQTHHAYVSAREGSLHFEFTTGIIASYWTEADRKMADDRAEAAARAARPSEGGGDYRGTADDPPMAACPYCGKINLVSAPSCTCCGASAALAG